MIIKRADLYEILQTQCPGKYSIGLHGINVESFKSINGVETDLSDNELSTMIAKNILRNGLKVESSKSINGTVKFFGRLDINDDLKHIFKELSSYKYTSAKDYIIIASPVEFSCEDGTKLYVGATNTDSSFKNYFDSTDDEITTIFDKVVLNETSTVDPKFILGHFKILDDETIDLEINDQHISKRQGIMSKQEFTEYVDKLKVHILFDYPYLLTTFLKKDLTKIRELTENLTDRPHQTAYLLETISQLLNEEEPET